MRTRGDENENEFRETAERVFARVPRAIVIGDLAETEPRTYIGRKEIDAGGSEGSKAQGHPAGVKDAERQSLKREREREEGTNEEEEETQGREVGPRGGQNGGRGGRERNRHVRIQSTYGPVPILREEPAGTLYIPWIVHVCDMDCTYVRTRFRGGEGEKGAGVGDHTCGVCIHRGRRAGRLLGGRRSQPRARGLSERGDPPPI